MPSTPSPRWPSSGICVPLNVPFHYASYTGSWWWCKENIYWAHKVSELRRKVKKQNSQRIWTFLINILHFPWKSGHDKKQQKGSETGNEKRKLCLLSYLIKCLSGFARLVQLIFLYLGSCVCICFSIRLMKFYSRQGLTRQVFMAGGRAFQHYHQIKSLVLKGKALITALVFTKDELENEMPVLI